MKHTKVLTTVSLILIVTLVPFTGCSTTPKPEPTGVTYSFAESGSPSATIDFLGDTSNGFAGFINYNGAGRPKPEENTYWTSRTAFPAEEPLALTIRAKYDNAPSPMLGAAWVFVEIGQFFMNAATFGSSWIWVLFLGLPLVGLSLASFTVSLSFCALGLVVDLPMALAINFDKKVAFDCPPLEADRSYAIRLERKKPRKLVLVDTDTDMVVYEQGF